MVESEMRVLAACNRAIRSALKGLFRRAGYDISRSRVSTNSWGWHTLKNISAPRMVIDVGVGCGTDELHNAFPDAHFVLVEPLREYVPCIDALQRRYSCDVFYTAVSDQPGEREFMVDSEDFQKSSFARRTSLTRTGHRVQPRKVPVTTLDRILDDISPVVRPILMKIDTEGHELSALRGACRLLQLTDSVVVEVSVAARFEGGYEFEDIISFMKESGFALFCFLSINQKHGELQPRTVDAVFRRREGVRSQPPSRGGVADAER